MPAPAHRGHAQAACEHITYTVGICVHEAQDWDVEGSLDLAEEQARGDVGLPLGRDHNALELVVEPVLRDTQVCSLLLHHLPCTMRGLTERVDGAQADAMLDGESSSDQYELGVALDVGDPVDEWWYGLPSDTHARAVDGVSVLHKADPTHHQALACVRQEDST